MRSLDLCANPCVDPAARLLRWRTAGTCADRRRSQLGGLMIFLTVLFGASQEAQAKGRSKTWAPPIPPGRAAVTLSIRSINAANARVPARVMWGRRLLGDTPLSLQWPADSGPVDIVVVAQGQVRVHTRLYTFADDKVVVKMVDDEGKKALFGYKREAPAASAAAPAPVPSSPVPSSPVPATPVPAAPVPSAPVPAAPVPSSPVPAAPVPSSARPSG